MGSRMTVVAVAILAVVVIVVGAGCGGSGAMGTPTSTSSSPADATGATGGVTAAAVPALTLGLSTTLNGTGTVKATAITKAELLNTAGVVVANATIASGKASFPISTLTAGHYFIRVNSLSTNLVPTKLDSITVSTAETVGTTLRTAVIGTLAAPKYKFTTYALGQAQHAVVGYLTGLSYTPVQYGYALLYVTGGKVETRVLGTAALLTTVTLGGPHNNATWVLGATNHGKSVTNSCAGCHGTLTKKPATYASISAGNGWCYKCHYGNVGISKGLVNPTK